MSAATEAGRCPECGHAPHGGQAFCPNWASDNDCSCAHGRPAPAEPDAGGALKTTLRPLLGAHADIVANHLLASDWLATVLADARREGEAKALREAADEMWRIFLRLPHTPSRLGDYIQRRVTGLRARAASIGRSES